MCSIKAEIDRFKKSTIALVYKRYNQIGLP